MLLYIITTVTLIGTVANSLQKNWCFYLWIPTNAFYTIHNVITQEYAQVILYAVNTITSIIGIIQWNKKARTEG